jgi:hypothetical protein
MENASNRSEYRKRWPLWLLLLLLVAASVTMVAIPVFVHMPFKPQTAADVEWFYWLVLLLLVAASMTMVAIPVFVHMPFKPQTAAGVGWSYRLRRFSPPATVVALVLSLALCAGLWHDSHGWSRLAMILLLALLIVATWFSRQSYYYEWMFRPLSKVAYAPIRDATFVSDSDMVLAVEVNGEAVAYPIRQLAYHHIINDQVSGRPITATY